jgi:transposase-like protein
MNFETFLDYFPSSEHCLNLLKQIRENELISCKQCGNDNHYWKHDKQKFECKNCNYRMSLKAGTIMENSKLPIRFWMASIYYIHVNQKTISTKDIQRGLNHNRYEPIWNMHKKIKTLTRDHYLCQSMAEYINISY